MKNRSALVLILVLACLSILQKPVKAQAPAVPIAAVSLGQNANLNGYKPFPGSVAYTDVSGYSVDSTNNSYFHGAVAATTGLDMGQVAPGSDMQYYILNSATDSSVYWVPVITEYEKDSGSYNPESDHTMLPLKAGIQGEGGRDITTCLLQQGNADVHAEIIDVATHTLYGLYNARTCNGQMIVAQMSVWNLDQPFEVQHPRGRTSDDVAGMAVWSGILGVRSEDYKNGAWTHAARWTMHLASKVSNYYGTIFQFPASHGACGGGNCSDVRATVFGQRTRLRASFNEVTAPDGNPWNTQERITIQGLKKFGTINADNGNDMAVQGTADTAYFGDWSRLNQIKSTDFEVVDMGQPALAAQGNPEGPDGGISDVVNQSAIYNFSGGTGPAVPNNPGPPTITSFQVSAPTINIGQSVTFTYAGTNVTNAFIDNVGGAQYGNSGSFTWTPSGPGSYKLTVLGYNGWAVSSPLTVNVVGPTVTIPVATPGEGVYSAAQSVTLSTSTPGAAIYYTDNGDAPNPASTPYTGTINVASNVVIKAIATKSGYISSGSSTNRYIIRVPGATPTIVGNSSTYGFTDTTSTSLTYDFSPGDSAVIFLGWVNTTDQPTSVACGSTSATLVKSQLISASTPWTAATYLVPSVAAGFQICSATWATSIYGTIHVSEISGSSGVDAFSSGVTITYPTINCGTLTTTGSNRLALVSAVEPFSSVTASSNYTQLFSISNFGGAAMGVPTAGNVTPTMHTNNDGGVACVAVALKPTPIAPPPSTKPTIVGDSTTASFTDTTATSVSYTFAGSSSAVISLGWINTTNQPTSVVCGSTQATLVRSQLLSSSDPWTSAIYVAPGVAAGTQTCSATWSNSIFGTIHVTEVSNTSGVDVSSSGTTITYPTINCGTLMTTGANRLVIIAAVQPYSAVTASQGYTQLFSVGNFGGGAIDVATGSSFTPTLHTNNDGSTGCVAIALKPVETATATPTIVANSSTAGFADASTSSVAASFGATHSAVIFLAWVNTTDQPTSVACGSTPATLVRSQLLSATDPWTSAIYLVPNVAAGSQSCSATWASSVYSTIHVTEISGSSGFDASSSGTSITYPTINCGSLTTTGSNRLVLLSAVQPYSSVTASQDYTQLFTVNSFGGAAIGAPTPGLFTPTLHTNNDGATGCVAVALHP